MGRKFPRTNLQNVGLGTRWISKSDVFKFNQTGACFRSLGAVGRVFGFSVQVLKDLLGSTHPLHESRVYRRYVLEGKTHTVLVSELTF